MLSESVGPENTPLPRESIDRDINHALAAGLPVQGETQTVGDPRSADRNPEDQAGRVDERESLANDCLTGTFQAVSLPQDTITRLHGILLDFDRELLDEAAFAPGALDSPETFFARGLKPILNREKVFRSAEVRASGRGLHLIIRLDPPKDFANATDRDRWAAYVQLLQSLLPTDPCCPGITALTRPLGSVNGKNHKVVRSLREGQPVSPERVLELVERVRRAPFETICRLLHGGLTARPCPRCQKTGSQMRASATKGDCYHCKSKLQIADLLKPFYNALDTRENGESEVDHD